MSGTKNNPKLSHDQWLEVQKEHIKMILKLKEENSELKREKEILKERNEILEAEIASRNAEVDEILTEKAKKVILTGDSQMKSKSIERLEEERKIDVPMPKTYCSLTCKFVNYITSQCIHCDVM